MEQKNNFIKLRDGQSVTGVLRGEEIQFHQKYDNRNKKYITCTRENGGNFAFVINLIIKTDTGLEAKLLQGTWKTKMKIEALSKQHDLDVCPITISRKGSAMSDTEYTVSAGKPLPADKIEEIDDVELLTYGQSSAKPMFFGRKGDQAECPF